MPTAAAPEKAMATSKNFRVSGGLQTSQSLFAMVVGRSYKFLVKFSDPQSSTIKEKMARTGMLSKLL